MNLANTGWSQITTFTCAAGIGAPVDPIVPLAPLTTIENPVLPGGNLRPDLAAYIQNKDAAIRLGKALYWEMQAGSDNKVACATCHLHAGQDPRLKNQMHPGANGAFNLLPPNASLQKENYPFTTIGRTKDTDDIAGSQGVTKNQFVGIGANGEELTQSVADPVFTTGSRNVRQVTGVHSPSTVNAVFNHRNFWNGRAQNEFNGVSPFGDRDTAARVWKLDGAGNPAPVKISIPNASLASQAVGPPTNDVEMSAMGRTFPDIGRKLLRVKPLGLQQVAATDGTLGTLADTATGKGLNVTYGALIQQAFQPEWWNSAASITVNGQPYTMMEANFAFYWGLAVMMYEATLVSGDTPLDRYLNSGRINLAAFDPVVNRLKAEGLSITHTNILNGLTLFEIPLAAGGAGCIECHGGPEMTLASVSELTGQHPEGHALKNQGFDIRMERMFMQIPFAPTNTVGIAFDHATSLMTAILNNGTTVSVPLAVYDAGFYNIGVRATAENFGLGGLDIFGLPLSFIRMIKQSANPGAVKVPGEPLACLDTNQIIFTLAGPVVAGEADDVDGTFKTPGLRNVELNGPYFHNGGKSTLAQVTEFYDDGSDFPENPTLAPLIMPMHLTHQDRVDIVAFLVALTDERVRWQRAPFDHPQILLPAGQNEDGTEVVQEWPAVGAAGAAAPLQRFLDLNPFEGLVDPTTVITVTAPGAGASWQKGTVQTIRWNSVGMSENVKIFVSQNGGPWINIAWNVANSGAFNWTIRQNASANCKIRVTSMIDNTIFGESAPFTITAPPTIAVSAPVAGANWQKGTIQTVMWTSQNLTGNVKIFVSQNGGIWTNIAWNIANTGTFNWLVNQPASANCRIRVTSMSNNAIYGESGLFTIGAGAQTPTIAVTSPGAGASWAKNSVRAVTWTSANITGNVKIFVSLNGGGWTSIAYNIANTGSFNWTIRQNASVNCKIRVTSMNNNLVFGESGLFTITP